MTGRGGGIGGVGDELGGEIEGLRGGVEVLGEGFIAGDEDFDMVGGSFSEGNASRGKTPDFYDFYEDSLKNLNGSIPAVDKEDIYDSHRDINTTDNGTNDDNGNADIVNKSNNVGGDNGSISSRSLSRSMNLHGFDMAISDELSSTSGFLYDDSNGVYVDNMNLDTAREGHFLNSKNIKFDNSIIVSDIPQMNNENSNKILKSKKKSTEILNRFRNSKDDNYENSKSMNLFGIKGKGQTNENNQITNNDKIMKNLIMDNFEKRLKSNDNRFGQNLNFKAAPKRGLNRGKNLKLGNSSLKMSEFNNGDNEIEANQNEVDDSVDIS